MQEAKERQSTFETSGDIYNNPYDMPREDAYALFRYLSHLVSHASRSEKWRERLASVDVERLPYATLVMLKCLLDEIDIPTGTFSYEQLRLIDSAKPLDEELQIDEKPMLLSSYRKMGLVL